MKSKKRAAINMEDLLTSFSLVPSFHVDVDLK